MDWMAEKTQPALTDRASFGESMSSARSNPLPDWLGALIGAIGFFALATISLGLSKFDTTLASIWLPNAGAVAFLLRARLANEGAFYFAVFASSVFANNYSGTPLDMALIFSSANILDITLVTWLTRKLCGQSPDMKDLHHLGHFIWIGGLAGPLASSLIAGLAMGADYASITSGAVSWFLTDSMGMIIIVPTALLLADTLGNGEALHKSKLLEQGIVLTGGMTCAFLVFSQDVYPLLFLIPPITLFHAFRMGSLGTAFYIAGVAIVTSSMTYAGYGPIDQTATSPSSRLHLVQAFIAANFLIGLPVAATLAGRERMMAEIEAKKRHLDLLADNITDAVLRYDLEGRCTYASPSVRDVLNEAPSTFIGALPTDRMHQDAQEQIATVTERLVSGESEKERFTYRRFTDSAEGDPVYIEADCAIAFNPETGEREGIVVSARDVTERVELELLLTRARRHAENAARAKSEFLANMSHEIRTPMNGVLGFAELILESELDQDQRRQAELIVHSGRTMMLILNDILDLSKIEAGQIAISRGPVNLHNTLSECTALHQPASEKKGITIRFENEGRSHEEDAWVITDGLRVRQIALNLVGNAVKFTETGQVTISYAIENDQCRISVRDTGIGISRARLATIFQPFVQAESDTARRYGGTGLGLTISRELAEFLGGTLEVESEAGVGSCFTLTLPAGRAGAMGQAQPAPLEHGSAIAIEDLPQDARLLLVEDHDINRILATEMLERCNQKVAVAHDGNEAIAMVIDSIVRGTPYDLVLMDIQMPGCDGYAATRAIRGEGITADDLPIIALTANAFPEDIAAARDAGMQGHLSKPIDFAELARMLQRWLPTRIVEEAPRTAEKDGDPSTAFVYSRAKSQQNQLRSDDPTLRTHDLRQRWHKRRCEALASVRSFVERGLPADEKLRTETMRHLHKLAGTAAMFGEEELGEQASVTERALRSDQPDEAALQMAADLLVIADSASMDESELHRA